MRRVRQESLWRKLVDKIALRRLNRCEATNIKKQIRPLGGLCGFGKLSAEKMRRPSTSVLCENRQQPLFCDTAREDLNLLVAVGQQSACE